MPRKSKTGSPAPLTLTPWETPPEGMKITSKLLTDMEVIAVEARLSRKTGARSRIVTDERAAELEQRLTRNSIVRDVLGTTESVLKSRRWK